MADNGGSELTDATENAVREAEDALYDHLDKYGAGKRAMHLISALIDAKIAAALAPPQIPDGVVYTALSLRDAPPLPGESNARIIAGPREIGPYPVLANSPRET